MKLTFRIEYRTAWGEELGVILDGNNSEPIILRTPNGEHWEGEAEMPDLPACVPVSAVKAEPWLICFAPEKRKTATTY